MPTTRLTDVSCEKLTAKDGARTRYFDKLLPGFCLDVTKDGARSFRVVYRVRGDGTRRKRWLLIGRYPDLKLADARQQGASVLRMAAAGRDPIASRDQEAAEQQKTAEPAKTVTQVLAQFMRRYVRKDAKLRSARYVLDVFQRLVKPTIGNVSIYALRRSQVIEMLDKIADENGLVMADRTLAHLRKALNWWTIRDEEFRSPIVKGMARVKPKERARSRVLDDQEIRDLWAALEGITKPACYPQFIRALLLTAARRDEVAGMQWSEIDDASWTIPAERYKTGVDHLVPLTRQAQEVIGERPRNTQTRPFVISSTGGAKPFSGYSKAKVALDQKLTELRAKDGRDPMPGWTHHDLRRTAKTLMARAGVRPDISERVLGHVIAGVEATYDRHGYIAEKLEALERLAAMVDRILKPDPPANVVAPPRRHATGAAVAAAAPPA